MMLESNHNKCLIQCLHVEGRGVRVPGVQQRNVFSIAAELQDCILWASQFKETSHCGPRLKEVLSEMSTQMQCNLSI